MPKTKVAPSTDDLPIWDALVTELGDPRPYEPTAIDAAYVVPDEYFLDETIAYDTASAQLERDAHAVFTALTDVQREAVVALDELYPWPEVAGTTDDAASALAQLDVEATLVLPAWPVTVTTDVVTETRGEPS